jgi:hypothetical protein
MVADWIAWLRAWPAGDAADDFADALVMVLESAHASTELANSDAGQRARPAMLELASAQLDALAGHPRGLRALHHYICAWQDAAPADRQRALELVRRTPPSSQVHGGPRLRLLRALGAVITIDDVRAALRAAQLGSEVAADSFAVLRDALALPELAPADDSLDVLRAARATGTAPVPADDGLDVLRGAARDWYRTGALDAAWLRAALADRPPGLPLAPPAPKPLARPADPPLGAGELAALLATLDGDHAGERQRAAERLLAWPDAAASWPRVRDAYFAGRVAFDDGGELRKLAASLATSEPWPTAPRAERLVGYLSDGQLDVWLPGWLDAWAAGAPGISDRLSALRARGPSWIDRLAPAVVARVRGGDFRFARLLYDVPHAPLVELALQLPDGPARDDAMQAIAHLRPSPRRETPSPDARQDPIDPTTGASFEALLALIRAPGAELTVAVRAIRALTRHADASIAPLAELAVDERPKIRSAALRALRSVASREQALDAALQALAIEPRRDVELGLIASLGHGRHAPALPALIERLIHRDPRVHQAAHAALRAWGRDVIPAVRDAARKARPDRRPRYQALLDELA